MGESDINVMMLPKCKIEDIIMHHLRGEWRALSTFWEAWHAFMNIILFKHDILFLCFPNTVLRVDSFFRQMEKAKSEKYLKFI